MRYMLFALAGLLFLTAPTRADDVDDAVSRILRGSIRDSGPPSQPPVITETREADKSEPPPPFIEPPPPRFARTTDPNEVVAQPKPQATSPGLGLAANCTTMMTMQQPMMVMQQPPIVVMRQQPAVMYQQPMMTYGAPIVMRGYGAPAMVRGYGGAMGVPRGMMLYGGAMVPRSAVPFGERRPLLAGAARGLGFGLGAAGRVALGGAIRGAIRGGAGC
jgi:hypothetical protein